MDTKQCKLKWDNCVSTPFQLGNGVKQGSGLSPILFNFYVNSLSKEFKCVKLAGW